MSALRPREAPCHEWSRPPKGELDIFVTKEQGRATGVSLRGRDAEVQRETLPRRGRGAGYAAASGLHHGGSERARTPGDKHCATGCSSEGRGRHQRLVRISTSERGVRVPCDVTVNGALDETLIYNSAGLVMRQIENTPAATATFSSPYGSFSFPEATTSVYTYPGGATLGSTANFKSSGLLRFGLVPGFGVSNAGIDIVANAVVVGFTPEGIPMVDFTESTVVISHGNRNSDEEIFSAICAALGPA
jgi:hypothetical protein